MKNDAQADAVPESWRSALTPVLKSSAARKLGGFLSAQEAAGTSVYPPRGQRLRALELTPLGSVKAVILGQDPYHGPGQAHGLSFSVPEGVKIPPSLANIYKELASDLNMPIPRHGNLEAWAREGVLLLNTALTVEAHKAASHAGKGWEHITDAIIAAVAAREAPTVFILWGSHAQKKADIISGLAMHTQHLILKGPHPSPLSAYRGFFGSRPFSAANIFLERHGRGAIDWRLSSAG
ncbi:uracil-DNA glycosylase [Pontixanthobacter sp.]|uniref:uracil-DNA glycosylase n=1 Tax=Pontixanthobacter sp. TaxID=2792078 RepID=UPI003C798E94